ncbi:hypothetical protein [uncultured Ruegeria sp.]|uniref:hypothetical protein n=1 Tax=uncultured Ruegeria sp. TaxID=259304 RepID=UPI002638187C|nr:hypothetical protein [uncultured Ruegeria sp.]
MDSPIQKSRKDRKERNRRAKARSASFRILELRERISSIVTNDAWNEQKTSELKSLVKELSDKEQLLRGWSYSVAECLEAAVEYRKELDEQHSAPRPHGREGVSTYGKGQKPKRWS